MKSVYEALIPLSWAPNTTIFLIIIFRRYKADCRYGVINNYIFLTYHRWKMSIYQYRVRYKDDEDVFTVRSAKANTLLDLVEQYRLTSIGLDGLQSKYSKDTALCHLMYPIMWPKKYKDR